jgi:putative tricarboxylic transport membrane protein
MGFSFGTLSYPKAGFVPMIAGLGALILAIVNLFSTWFDRGLHDVPLSNAKQVAYLVLGLVGVLILLQIVGFAIATFVGMIYLLKVSGTRGWKVPLAVSACLSGGLFFVFGHLLKVPLP